MFKWPGVPSPLAPEHELADFAELVCWRQGFVSVTELAQSLGRLAENDYSGGVPEEDDIPNDINSAFREIELRIEACDGGYPFDIDEKGNALHIIQNSGNSKYTIYKYLLLATRLNMSNNRVHADVDGTLLFEELSAEAGRYYLGNGTESLVFGTAVTALGFPAKVDDLCAKIREGDGYANRDGITPNEKDGKLDVVLWKQFADQLPGKLIAFGQCKTGTDYKDTLTQLQPDSFCRKWLQTQLSLPPVRMFFVAEALRRGSWYYAASDAGLLFDRCRIIDFCDDISYEVFEKIESWTETAAQTTDLPGL